MTEPDDRGRIDLAPLAPDVAEAERMIGAVMAGLASRPQLRPEPGTDILVIVGRQLAPRWIAAAVVLAIAGSAAVISMVWDRPSAASPDAFVAAWIDRQHVPTNGELLVAFQGYPR